jgi:hypothetical protein
MTDEEIRKAFEAWWLAENTTPSKERKRCAFAGWKAAMAYSEEMRKPTVKIVPCRSNSNSSYPFVVSLFEGSRFDGALEDFRTEDDAVEWALTNGYRVIE